MNLASRTTAALAFALALLAGSGRSQSTGATSQDQNVTRATLSNGLRVVIVRDPIAPVVTVEDNILAGGDETPDGFPGMAHAQEHMLFRGCTGLSGPQISAIYAQLGGVDNADTQQTVTQYFATVPAEDLDVVLHVDSACLAGAQDSQAEWAQERGAIEQEVARDLSNATYKFITRLNSDMFAGTPYAHDALGTKASFDATTGAMLHKFYRTWYAPNNAILVITGDVDPTGRSGESEEPFMAAFPGTMCPPRPAVNLSAGESPKPSPCRATCPINWCSWLFECPGRTVRISRRRKF